MFRYNISAESFLQVVLRIVQQQLERSIITTATVRRTDFNAHAGLVRLHLDEYKTEVSGNSLGPMLEDFNVIDSSGIFYQAVLVIV